MSRKDLYNDAKRENGNDMMMVEQNQPGNEGRIRNLETRLMHIEAVFKGLNEEMSDLKSTTSKYTATLDEHPAAIAVPSSDAAVFQPQFTAAPPMAQTIAPKPEQYDLIMQSDGTLKPERRAGNDFVIVK
ncbi:MAG: hypothetical protein LUQ40_04210 [Methanomicrobiales archaeon]|nr:hypothetical protein [Methanomicrobiales archaeon]